ncbi:MAG: hypothetical protein HFH45_02545 [Bacilli bacterium]|nr:hypothetical protein [Bacilli bacterium]
MNRKKLGKIFRFTTLTLFITFVALYISQSAGYVEYENRKQVALTQNQIKKFEADVKKGKQVDIEKYLKTNEKNYQNNISKVGLKVSKIMEKGVNKAVDVSFKFLGKLSE